MPAPNNENRKFILENHDKMDNRQIAEAINITPHNVQNYKRRLGLTKNEQKAPYTEEQRKQARLEALHRYREKQAAQGIKPKQYYKPKTETPKRKSPAKSHLVSNNAPIEKVSKLSTSENPAKFKINNPYRPNDTNVRYEPRIDPNNGRLMFVERRVQG